MCQVRAWLNEYRTAKHLDRKFAAADGLASYIAPKLHRYISAFCPRDAVDDVLQESLVGIAQALPKFRGIGEFDHWCFRITHNKLVNYLEAERRRIVHAIDIEQLWKLIDASAETTALTVEARERLEEALELVTKAKPPCLYYLLQRFIYGLDFEELGRSMGKTKDAARVQVARCIELAKKLISKKGVAYA